MRGFINFAPPIPHTSSSFLARETEETFFIAQTSKIFMSYSSTIYRVSSLNPPNRPSILKVDRLRTR